MTVPQMTDPQRALQFWSVLVFAAKEQNVLSFATLAQMTGMVRQGAGRPLGYIYHYCKHHKLPLLNTLAISKDTGKPGAPSETDFDLSTEKTRVFVFDWLSHGAPSIQDFEAAQAAEQASVAQAAGLTA